MIKEEFSKTIEILSIDSRKVGVSKLNSRCMSLQKLICFIVYTTDCITCTSANMVRWAGRASLVIMNQEEKDMDTYTSNNSNSVSCAVLDSAVGGAKLYNFRWLAKAAVNNLFETCFSTLLMDTTEVGKDAFVRITALGGVKLCK